MVSTKPMSIRIRLVEQADFGEWLRLRLALWPDQTSEELAEELNVISANQEREPVFVAERPDGRLCGMLEAALHETAPGCTTRPVGYLEGWFVEPELRGQGIGGQLVAAAEAWARRMGCQEMASDTTPDYPLSPLAHARLGYEETDVPLHYRKRLTTNLVHR